MQRVHQICNGLEVVQPKVRLPAGVNVATTTKHAQ